VIKDINYTLAIRFLQQIKDGCSGYTLGQLEQTSKGSVAKQQCTISYERQRDDLALH